MLYLNSRQVRGTPAHGIMATTTAPPFAGTSHDDPYGLEQLFPPSPPTSPSATEENGKQEGEQEEAKKVEDPWGLTELKWDLPPRKTLPQGSLLNITGLTSEPVAIVSITPLTDGQRLLARVKDDVIVQLLTDEGARALYGRSIAEIPDCIDSHGFSVRTTTLTITQQVV